MMPSILPHPSPSRYRCALRDSTSPQPSPKREGVCEAIERSFHFRRVHAGYRLQPINRNAGINGNLPHPSPLLKEREFVQC